MKCNYKESCEKAEFIGYEPKEDLQAYNGIAYINDDGKIWIHDIDALSEKLGVKVEELEALNYNVEDYYKYEGLSLKATMDLCCKEEALSIFGGLPLDGDGLVYISDGMYMTKDGDIVEM